MITGAHKKLLSLILSVMLVLGLVASDVPILADASSEQETEAQSGDSMEGTELTEEVSICLSDLYDFPSNEEMLNAYVEDILYGESGIALMADYGEDKLTDENELALYYQLLAAVKNIAAGTVSSTVVTCSDISWTWTLEELGYAGVEVTTQEIANEVASAARSKLSEVFDHTTVLLCVIRDCPYDMYWADVTSSTMYSYSFSFRSSDVTMSLSQVVFPVADAYAGTEANTVDAYAVAVANAAAENAWEIVQKYSSYSDYDKLVAFKNEICALASYNYDAANDDTTPYGDPWQLIYVFDGDDSTTVVCEGYSKAFQYLCDLSGIDGCYTVTGTMTGGTGAGEHMWNVVHLNGIVYMVDVTDSDTGTIGSDGSLFLVNADDAVTSSSIGYSFSVNGTTVTYTYDPDTIALYTEAILTLTSSIISLEDAEVTVSGTYIYDGSALTPAADAITVTLNGDTISSDCYTVSVTNNTDAGTATVTITGSGSYTGSAVGTFTINPKTVSNPTIVLSESSYTYDGTAKTPTVTVKDGDTVISSDEYTVSYSDNVNAGTATVTITDAMGGNYTVSGSTTFTIGTVSLRDVVVSVSGTYTYNGTAQTPEASAITVALNGNTISSDNYTVSVSNNTNAGTATVTITGTGNYEGSATGTFTIAPKTVSAPTIELSRNTYEYDGTAKTPTVTVKDGTTVISSEEYTVAYADNVEKGTATVTISDVTGGNYTVSGSTSFTITEVSLEEAEVTVSGSYTYDGTAKIPAAGNITVTLDGETVDAENYTVSVTDNVNAGTATVTITGIGNYGGSTTGTFTIAPKVVNDPTIELSDSSYIYDGTAKTPTVTVKDGDVVISSEEYTVSYSDNVNAGTATVTITDATGGNYTVSGSATFTIGTASLADATVTVSGTYTYNGTAQIPAASDITVTLDGEAISSDNYTVSVTNNTDAGTATVTITGIGNYGGSATGTFTITAKTVSNPTIVLSETTYEYDGTAKEPAVTVKDGDTVIASGEYTVSYFDNVNAGAATVTITDVSGGNYTVSGSATFTITAISLAEAEVAVSGSYIYDGTAQTPAASDITVTLDGETISSDNYTVSVTNNTDVGTATVTITGIGNYGGSTTGTFTIDPKVVNDPTIELLDSSYVYDGTAKTPTVTVKDGDTAISSDEYTVSYSDNVNAGTATVIITDVTGGNYMVSGSTTFTIAAKTVSSPTIELSQDTYEYDGTAKEPTVTVKDGDTVISPDEYTVTYSDNVEKGTATVTITDVSGGNYTVSGVATFAIVGVSLEEAEVTVSGSYTYDGTAKIPAASNITVTLNGETVDAENYTVSVTDNVNTGMATVTITGIGNYGGSATGTFTIAPKVVNAPTIELSDSSYVYDGTAKTPTVTVKDGETVISSDEYTVSYSDNVNAGAATVTITDATGGNYTVSGSTSFIITEVSMEEAEVTVSSSYTYDGTAKIPAAGDITVTLDGETISSDNYTVSVTNNTDAGTATVTITGIGNYGGSTTGTFTIDPKIVNDPTIELSDSSYVYDGTAKTPTVTVKDGDTVISSDEYTVSYSDNVNAGTAIVTITDVIGGNYTVIGSTTFTITEVQTTEETTEGNTEEETEGNTEENTEESTEGSTEEATEGTTEKETEGTTEEATEGTTEESTEGTTEESTEGNTEEATEGTTEEVTEGTTEENTEEPTGEASGEETTEQLSGEEATEGSTEEETAETESIETEDTETEDTETEDTETESIEAENSETETEGTEAEDTETEAETTATENTEDDISGTGAASSDSGNSSASASTNASSPKTADASPILPIMGTLLGCAAVVLAFRKRRV